MQSLRGKVALVTGAAGGIGQAICLQLAGAGALVIAHYGGSRKKADDLVRQIVAAGGAGFSVGADLTRRSEIARMFDAIDAELAAAGADGIDILVNNAGVSGGGKRGSPQSLENMDEEMLDQLLATNVKGTFFVSQLASPRLRDGGRIINISSTVALYAFPYAIGYAMSKAAVNSLTKSLALHFGPRKITVNAIMPGATRTDFIRTILDDPADAEHYAQAAALGRLGEPADIAKIVYFLASDDGGWVSGQLIEASGGANLG